WLGEGDFYLALALAIIFGWELFVTNIVISYFLGAIIGIALLATKKATKKTAIPFGPFLVLGAIITIFFGQDLMNLYLSNLTI
ncbi:MAG TPA: prepilin peptidase, partial [Candidatus Gracilibacteria bacterium]|nr:prepilin peptidase [Candidatus Gracilibacteria bacterium]